VKGSKRFNEGRSTKDNELRQKSCKQAVCQSQRSEVARATHNQEKSERESAKNAAYGKQNNIY